MTNLEKIDELEARNEGLATLMGNMANLLEENSKRIILNEKWLIGLTDLVSLLYEHEKMVNPAKNKIHAIDVKKHMSKKLAQ